MPCIGKTARRTIIVSALALLGSYVSTAVYAAAPAETFISENIQKGLSILNNTSLTTSQRSAAFEELLLSMTDTKRIALFTLGQYANKASQADKDAFTATFESYSVAVYRSYLARYSGQTLRVAGSSARGPDDFIVTSHMIDPNDHSGNPPLEIDFRVRTDTGRPELTDLNVMGIWLTLSERDQFGSFLNAHDGNVAELTAHVRDVTNQYH
jgi:phospholipid transport system substrate-binding protein